MRVLSDFGAAAKFITNEFFSFNVLILLYVINTTFIVKVAKIKFIPRPLANTIQIKFSKFFVRVAKRIDKNADGSISKLDLIQLAIRNMKVKKMRTAITIGGVSIGIGAIVFLVSLGYGLQSMVIGRVARLEELKQADVSIQPGSRVSIDDKTLSDVKSFSNVADVYPLIAAVGRVNYQNSVSDMAVYGVTTGYLEKSAIKPIQGKVFESNDISVKVSMGTSGEVAGASTSRKVGELGEKIGDIDFAVNPNAWVRVRKGPTTTSAIIGYTKHVEGIQTGAVVWGSAYPSDDDAGSYGETVEGDKLGKWIKSKVDIWEEVSCTDDAADCVDGKYKRIRNDQDQFEQQEGYFAFINVSVKATYLNNTPAVLGESSIRLEDVLAAESTTETTESTTSAGSFAVIEDTDNADWVHIPDETGAQKGDAVTKVNLAATAVRKAVVNRAMLKILGLTEEEAVGKTFSTSFVLPSNLLADSKGRVESNPADYEIVGVTPDDVSPVFYVPFVDLRSLGITKYSQFKVLTENKESLEKVRKQIETIGYNTQSVADTVEQINSLFGTLRFALGIMGMIALAVASLGMFNTLTVSLLERTREVGLMKAMGMKTAEVQELFLTESMIMGFCAGFLGLLIGFVGGKAVGLLLTVFSVVKGQGIIDISYIPFNFVLTIMALSLVVGLFTGIFPARRSKKISALDALRYE